MKFVQAGEIPPPISGASIGLPCIKRNVFRKMPMLRSIFYRMIGMTFCLKFKTCSSIREKLLSFCVPWESTSLSMSGSLECMILLKQTTQSNGIFPPISGACFCPIRALFAFPFIVVKGKETASRNTAMHRRSRKHSKNGGPETLFWKKSERKGGIHDRRTARPSSG